MEEFSKQESTFFAMLAIAIIAVSLLLVFAMLLSRPAETYTELYFALNSVKEQATVGELPITFFVENHEGKSMDYTYSILVNGAAAKEGALSLSSGEKEGINETVLLSRAGENQKIEVMLESSFKEPYTIFFWVDVVEQ